MRGGYNKTRFYREEMMTSFVLALALFTAGISYGNSSGDTRIKNLEDGIKKMERALLDSERRFQEELRTLRKSETENQLINSVIIERKAEGFKG